MSRVEPTTSPKRSPCDLPTEKSTASFWHSQPSPLLIGHRSTRELPETADVVVIGSGITGASVVHHLLCDTTSDARPNVVLLEAREACWGATGRNGGHCHPNLFEHPEEPAIGRFELANYQTIRALIEDKKIDCEWNCQPGCVALYSQDDLDKAKLAISKIQDNAPDLEPLLRLATDPYELNFLRVPTALGVVANIYAARLWPYKFVARILEDLITATDLHGTFNLQTLTPVLGLHTKHDSHGVLVRTARGTVQAGTVVLATNGYTSHLLPEFTDLIVPCRGQMSALRPPREVQGENRLTKSLSSWSAERGDAALNGRELEAEYMWTGIMGFSRDEKPWVGRVPGYNDMIYLAAGYTGHGMPNAWLCGKAVAMTVGAVLDAEDADVAAARAAEAVGLPESYKLTAERIARAAKVEDVASIDWAELSRSPEFHGSTHRRV